jgi:hypothetical protein
VISILDKNPWICIHTKSINFCPYKQYLPKEESQFGLLDEIFFELCILSNPMKKMTLFITTVLDCELASVSVRAVSRDYVST